MYFLNWILFGFSILLNWTLENEGRVKESGITPTSLEDIKEKI